MQKIMMTLATAAASAVFAVPTPACSGITLKSADGALVAARTVEWAGSKFGSQYVVVPRGYRQQSFTIHGRDGMQFQAKYGYVGLSTDMPEFVVDGLNEKGLCCELFFFPGYGEYPPLDPTKLDVTIGDMQLCHLLLGSCATIDDVKEVMSRVRVTLLVPGGGTSHWRITEPGGRQIVIEIVEGKVNYYDCIGVLTNAPGYPWHLTNLNNYINLHAGAAPDKQFDGIELKPISGGSGLLGLPGDFTSPSRFIRLAFFQNSARTQATAYGTVEQAFQILNNFDIPIGTAYAAGAQTPDMLSATQWTVATDLKNKMIYYHTNVNGHFRCIKLGDIDFGKVPYTVKPLDNVTQQPVEIIDIAN